MKRNKSMAKGLNFYKLFWIFIICSVIGYLLEMGWCYYYHGYFQSRKSLLYGPFSIIYGFGAVLIVLLVNLLKEASSFQLFLVATAVGVGFEYFCSIFQEVVFGTRSWNYTGDPFCIDGRANVLFAVAWGALAVLLVKKLLPLLDRLLEKLERPVGYIITWVFVAFMVGNMFLSASAVLRQGYRRMGIEAANRFERFLDQKYPDEVLCKVYANMKVAK